MAPSLAPPPAPAAHLAQYNIAKLRHPIGHPATAGFEALIDETNRQAEASPGFVWRHGIDSRDANDTPYDDTLVTVNASVWESLSHLRDFAYRGWHRDVYRRRGEWFTESAAVMWWIPAGSIPTLQACMARLRFHDRHGTSPYAFETGQQVPALVIAADPASDALHAWLDGEWAGAIEWRPRGDSFAVTALRLEHPAPLLRHWLVDALDALARDRGVPTIEIDGVARPVEPIRHRTQ